MLDNKSESAFTRCALTTFNLKGRCTSECLCNTLYISELSIFEIGKSANYCEKWIFFFIESTAAFRNYESCEKLNQTLILLNLRLSS